MYLIEMIRDGQYVTHGAYAMAMQVYVQQHIFLDEDILFPYFCDPHVQIGKYQNAAAEVNQDYIDKHQLPIVRRDTGGGAIYIDRGAVNFCYLTSDMSLFGDFKRAYEPAITALKSLGVFLVEQRGRNDLVIEGKKVSGSAMTITNNRIYGGYSLLLDADHEAMAQVLNPNRKKMASKGIASVRSRVGTIREYLAEEYQRVTADEFKDLMICRLMGIDEVSQAKRYVLTDEDWAAIDRLVAEKYQNWEWTFGNSPQYSYQRDGRFACGTIEIHLEIEKSRIASCKIYGDFFGKGDIAEVEAALLGTRMIAEEVEAVLDKLDLPTYFGQVTATELTGLIFS
ncbi:MULTISPECIES: lipoate--protein ligase [unclassified Streptococcus]|uniref:lipoate--protein ligase n=1 Tax=unclassified Streptococcus TaxID=2608887 RepID=UPI00359D891B